MRAFVASLGEWEWRVENFMFWRDWSIFVDMGCWLRVSLLMGGNEEVYIVVGEGCLFLEV